MIITGPIFGAIRQLVFRGVYTSEIMHHIFFESSGVIYLFKIFESVIFASHGSISILGKGLVK